jgi:pimeloyl-ACP methyl ester carboxylesterase
MGRLVNAFFNLGARCYALCALLMLTGGCSDEGEHFTESPDGVKISYEVKGDGEPAVVFIHGWSNNRSIWDKQISYFSEKYKTAAVDLAGFGRSGNNRDEWTISSFGGDIAAVVEELGEGKVILVGFSMGAPAAVEAAVQIPGRIAGLVLVESLHDIEMKLPPEAITVLDSVFMDLVTTPTLEKTEPFFRKNREESFKKVLAMLNTSRTGWRESLNNNFLWMNNECTGSLEKIKAPAAGIFTDQRPVNTAAIKKYLPSFKEYFIADAGHVVMWDAEDEFNRLLEKIIEEIRTEDKK